ncbi:MAG TPA: protein kinase [Polyangia bacterium]|nr:protein kinase [Polyangia bacterium]
MKKPIQFGKYYLLDRINVGGMAEVFKAKAFGVEGFERLLAVKRILPNIAEDEEFITMFIDEAKIAVQLNHANICQIFDLGKVEDSYFIALEHVHGKDLRAIFDRCKQKPVDGSTAMPIAQAAFIVMKACEGLDYAHNKRDPQGRELQLVHRDVSPQNVLISYEGEVKLIDFGIAKAAGKMSKTQQGILKGKFGYMSPEQVRGLPLDRRSDIFSLGIVLYELLTGERLFVGESDFSTLEKVRNVEILPPSTYNRRISDELERIVMKALAKDVDDRYQNAIDLHDDLQAFMYTAGEFYSRKDLAAWMKKVWAQEIEAETAKLEAYRAMPAPDLQRPTAGQSSQSPGNERQRRNSIPPPPPNASMAPARPSGQHAAVAPPAPPAPRSTLLGIPQIAHSNGNAAPAPPPVAARSGHPELGWDDEELATNIYDSPQDAEDAVVDDAPAQREVTNELDLSQIELGEGDPVPHPSVTTPHPGPAPSPSEKHRNGSAAAKPKPFEFVLPEPSGPIETPVHTRPGPRVRSRAPLYAGIGIVGTLLCALIVGVYFFLGSKPGEVVITSEPAVNVQVLVDDKRVEVDGTPATLKLQPGSYVLTVKREGYVPWNEQVEVKSGERISKRAVLEPLAAVTGFTLVSEPPGAQATLDGHALDGLTPLKVQSVAPGKHHLEVKSAVGSWTQDLELEAGKMTEVHAVLLTPTPPVEKPVVVAERDRPVKAQLPRPPKVDDEPRKARKPPVEDEGAKPEKVEKPVKAAVEKPVKVAAERPEKIEKPEKVEKPAVGGGEGYLRLGSKPWTNIAVDGKDSGQHTPQTHMKLPAGSHRITLTNPQFNIKETFSVDIKAGETETVIKDLRPQGADSDSD